MNKYNSKQYVICGDNMEVLSHFPDNYFDSVVTDAPYGLGKEPDAIAVLKDWVNTGYHEINSFKKGRKNCSGHILHNAIIKNSNCFDSEFQKDCIPFSIFISDSVMRSLAIQLNDNISIRKEKINSECDTFSFENALVDKINAETNQSFNYKNFCLGITQSFAGCISICSCFNQLSDTLFSVGVRLFDDSFGKTNDSAYILTSGRTELCAILTLDLGNRTGNLSIADSAIESDIIFEIYCPELIRAISTTCSCCFSFMSEPGCIGDINNSTDRAFSFNLFTHKNVIERLESPKILKSGFMGKTWDAFVPQPIFWKEVFRVLKPGGHVLCFFGTRTYDWGVMAIRLAGFEIRDCVSYIYGSGFPKSLDISKALDKSLGVEREVIGYTTAGKGIASAVQNYGGGASKYAEAHSVTAPTSDLGKKWEGYGTSLKPAIEPIVLARKPLIGTVAENILEHGVGGLNIDGCRIESNDTVSNHSRGVESAVSKGRYGDSKEQETHQTAGQKLGRFPANLILDKEAGAMLDQQTGTLKSGSVNGEFKGKSTVSNSLGKYANNVIDPRTVYADSGGASRFFYCPKVSKKERNKGAEDYVRKNVSSLHSRSDKCANCGGYLLQSMDRPSKCTCDNPVRENATYSNKGNTHPSIKPIDLMRYLVKLVTPPGGICGDFFNGSGGTGIACVLEDINYIGIEQDEDDVAVSILRMRAWRPKSDLKIPIFDDNKPESITKEVPKQLGMF